MYLTIGGVAMRYVVITVFIVFVAFFVNGCGNEEEAAPTTGTISGTVTFAGTPPENIVEIEVSIFAKLDEQGRPSGPPDYYSEPFTQFTGNVPYKISGVSFGTYKLAAVGYKKPDAPVGTAQTVLGMYGFKPPSDNVPDSFTVSEEKPDITGIDIVADYALITSTK
jgi:hypothetical protein